MMNKIYAAAVALLIAASGSDATISEVLDGAEYTSLKNAIAKAGVTLTAPVTMLAPKNAQFDVVADTLSLYLRDYNSDILKNVIDFHIFGTHLGDNHDFFGMGGTFPTLLNGQSWEKEVNSTDIQVNGELVKVTVTDQIDDGSYLFGVEKVLFPELSLPELADQFTTLPNLGAAVAGDAEIKTALESDAGVTIFVPATDASVDDAAEALQRHLVAGIHDLDKLKTMNGQNLVSLDGKELAVVVNGDDVTVDGEPVTGEQRLLEGVVFSVPNIFEKEVVVVPPTDGNKNAEEAIKETADFADFASLAQIAGFNLSSIEGTALVPGNAAISDFFMKFASFPYNKDLVETIVKYHILKNPQTINVLDAIAAKTELSTEAGVPLVKGDNKKLIDATGKSATYSAKIAEPLENGVFVHGLSKILNPIKYFVPKDFHTALKDITRPVWTEHFEIANATDILTNKSGITIFMPTVSRLQQLGFDKDTKPASILGRHKDYIVPQVLSAEKLMAEAPKKYKTLAGNEYETEVKDGELYLDGVLVRHKNVLRAANGFMHEIADDLGQVPHVGDVVVPVIAIAGLAVLILGVVLLLKASGRGHDDSAINFGGQGQLEDENPKFEV